MGEVCAGEDVTVYDDVLGEEAFHTLCRWAELQRYRGVHHESWRTVWRHGEGEPLRGPDWKVTLRGPRSRPTRGPQLPAALEPLRAALVDVRPSGDAAAATMTPWIYPQGTALGLHRDGTPYLGSYIYYTVREWDVHWGGLLHCLSEDPDDAGAPRAVLDHTQERRSVSPTGRGTWVNPKPRRLVVIGPHVRHFVSRVDSNAGDRARTSIAGFLLRS